MTEQIIIKPIDTSFHNKGLCDSSHPKQTDLNPTAGYEIITPKQEPNTRGLVFFAKSFDGKRIIQLVSPYPEYPDQTTRSSRVHYPTQLAMSPDFLANERLVRTMSSELGSTPEEIANILVHLIEENQPVGLLST